MTVRLVRSCFASSIVAVLAVGTTAEARAQSIAASPEVSALAGEQALAIYGFSLAELQEALRVRLDDVDATAIGDRLVIRALDADRLLIAYEGRKRTVQLDGLRGAAAARAVALHVVDLAGRERAPARVALVRARILDDKQTVEADRRAPARELRPRAVVAFAPSLGVGDEKKLLVHFGVGTSVRLVDGLRLVVDLAYAFGPQGIARGASQDREVRLHALEIKAGLGWWFARTPIELRALAIARPTWALTDAFATRQFVEGGVEVAVVAALPIRPSLRGWVAVGIDAFFTRHALQVDKVTAVATDRIAGMFSLGLAWSSRP